MPKMTFKEIRERISEAPERVRVALEVGNRSGLMWEVTAPGFVAMVKALTRHIFLPTGIQG